MNHGDHGSLERSGNRAGWTRIALGALGLVLIAGLALWLTRGGSGQGGGLALLVLFALPMLLGHGLHGHGGSHHSRRTGDPSGADPHAGHGAQPARPLRGTIDAPARTSQGTSEPDGPDGFGGAVNHAEHRQTGAKPAPHRHGGC